MHSQLTSVPELQGLRTSKQYTATQHPQGKRWQPVKETRQRAHGHFSRQATLIPMQGERLTVERAT